MLVVVLVVVAGGLADIAVLKRLEAAKTRPATSAVSKMRSLMGVFAVLGGRLVGF